MADTPKHKLLFGVPYGTATETVTDQIPVGQEPPATSTFQPWTWDTGEALFSSGVLTFDSEYDGAYRAGIEGLFND